MSESDRQTDRQTDEVKRSSVEGLHNNQTVYATVHARSK